MRLKSTATVSQKHFLAVIGLLLLIAIGFGNSLHNGFVWDDHELVVRNPDVRSGSLANIFSSGAWAFQGSGENSANNSYYRPLQILTYRVVDAIGGSSPFAFHLASLLLHCCATLLAYAVFYRLAQSLKIAVIGAGLFALHPIHTEAIDWIACSTELGCAVFLLLAFYCYLRRDHVWLCASLLSFLAALLWKEMAATLPLLITAYILLVEKRFSRLVVTIPYWLVLVAYFFLRRNALGVFYAAQSTWTLSPTQFVLTVVQLIGDYWWALLVPIRLNAYHVFGAINPLALVFACAILAVFVYGWKRWPLQAFAGLWVFLALLPVLNVYHLGSNIFGERYLYIPSIGFCLLLGLIAGNLPRREPLIAIAALLVLYCVRDMQRNQDWTDDYTLFSKTLQKSPNAAVINNLMGDLSRTEKNDLPQAEKYYRQAITSSQQSNPPQLSQLSLAYLGLAHVLDDTHQTKRALEALDEAQRNNPNNKGVDLAKAVILAEMGRWQEAKPILLRSLSANPNNDVALNTLGLIAWQNEHQPARAIDCFKRALSIGGTDITNASIHNNLGAIYGEQQKYDQAMKEFQNAAELDPQNPQYITNVGNLYGMQGHTDEAAAWFRRALEIQPGYPPASAGLAQATRAQPPQTPPR